MDFFTRQRVSGMVTVHLYRRGHIKHRNVLVHNTFHPRHIAGLLVALDAVLHESVLAWVAFPLNRFAACAQRLGTYRAAVVAPAQTTVMLDPNVLVRSVFE